jgi:DNA polymerase epsilon subunit 2
VEGEYTEDGTLEVVAMGQPPCEDRQTARSVSQRSILMLGALSGLFFRSIYGHIDFLGKGATSLLEDVRESFLVLAGISWFNQYIGTICSSHPRRTSRPSFLFSVGRMA